MVRSHHLGELQLAIMRILWERGDTTSYQFITFTLVNSECLKPE